MNYLRSETVNVSTAVQFIPTLNNASWAQISEVSQSGQGANYWNVGDCKAVTLNGTVGACTFQNEVIYVFIIGFDHNTGYEGNNRIHFQFGKTALTNGVDIAFCDSKYISDNGWQTTTEGYFVMKGDDSPTSIGGWRGSYMRSTICPAFKSVLPSDLQSVLRTITKYTDNKGAKSTAAENVTATTDDIFLLSEKEVTGETKICNVHEGNYQNQYAYYSYGNSIYKCKHKANSTSCYWWLRSQTKGNEYTTCCISGTMEYTATGLYSRASAGFAPGFCV